MAKPKVKDPKVPRYIHSGDPQPVMVSRRTAEIARREGLRIYEDGGLGDDRRPQRSTDGTTGPKIKLAGRPTGTTRKAPARRTAVTSPKPGKTGAPKSKAVTTKQGPVRRKSVGVKATAPRPFPKPPKSGGGTRRAL